ncbi:MAG: hypothetical protein Q4G65_08425 [bacterium]|nr:hypothetical protein [bacterium]
MINKEILLNDLTTAFEARVDELRKAVRTSQEMTRDAPGRIESRYDTSREETGWLATGQAALLGEWEHTLQLFRALPRTRQNMIQTGAYFEATSLTGPGRLKCFVCYGGSGLEFQTSQGLVTLVSPSSPLVDAALGRSVNDMFTVNGRADYLVREVA